LGNCAAGRVPDYRVFSNRADARHRYTTPPGHSGDSPQRRELITAANGPRHTVPPTPACEFDQRIAW
jgi:hypothetical protein